MPSEEKSTVVEPETVKQCCARLYESDVAKLLLGDSFHPGGVQLTESLGEILRLGPESRVLDVASGKGTSAIFLAERFGCEVTGIDYGSQNVDEANREAAKHLGERVRFERADAELLPVPDASFDAVICECAFCTFPNKSIAAGEFARVLRLGGQVGLSDLTREPVLPKELDSLMAWVACVADAQPIDRYAAYLRAAGLVVQHVEPHDEALTELVGQVRTKLLGAEIMVGLKKLDLPGVDFGAAKQLVKDVVAAIEHRQLGYGIITAAKPQHSSLLEGAR
jgi:ubiquinone/menaquinone biosynthesis C-methylase UbiE